MKRFDWMAGAALAMAIVGTASAEYQLAVSAGWGHVAFALPGCLDIYAVRALRAHRDMLAVLLVLIVVNSLSHLIAVGLLDPSVWVVIGVSSIAPAVLWRVHALRDEAPELPPEPMDDHFRTAAELTEVPAEPAPFQMEQPPVPVTLERVAEVSGSTTPAAAWPQLGPMVPVAELLAGTGPDQRLPGVAGSFRPTPEPAEPAPVVPEPQAEPDEPEPEPPSSIGGVPIARINTAREWLTAEPELSGAEIGRRLGTSARYGQRVRTAALSAPPLTTDQKFRARFGDDVADSLFPSDEKVATP